ncbi:MAG TPA: hypothetical protein VE907_11415 [Gammaproteobacteria bacterium]|nr:hypothetical protein [Gammaproteobacteria bacterium]
MSKLIVALLSAVPTLAGATPVLIEYEAKISYVADGCWCGDLGYHEGDRFNGKLQFDTDSAVRLPSPPDYGIWGGAGGDDFISGGGPPQRPGHAQGADQLWIIDAADEERLRPGVRGGDMFGFADHMRIPGGGDNRLQIQVSSSDIDFIHGSGPVQSFDTRDMPKDAPPLRIFTGLFGQLRGMSYNVGLELTRLKVTPGQCHR